MEIWSIGITALNMAKIKLQHIPYLMPLPIIPCHFDNIRHPDRLVQKIYLINTTVPMQTGEISQEWEGTCLWL
jgi:hypothetical protein